MREGVNGLLQYRRSGRTMRYQPRYAACWQRRYGLLKPQRSEGGHRQFDDEDILRIEEIKRLMKTGVSVGKVKALLENTEVMTQGNWASFQEEMLTVLRYANPAKLRAKIGEFRRDHAMDVLIDNIITPVRQRMNQTRIRCVTWRACLMVS